MFFLRARLSPNSEFRTLKVKLPAPTAANLFGFAWLGLIGAALTYALWFRGIARLESAVISPLLFLSPLTAGCC